MNGHGMVDARAGLGWSFGPGSMRPLMSCMSTLPPDRQFSANNFSSAFARWLTLTNALSGLFCASLNFIDSTKTIRPAILFEPEGHHSNTTGNGLRLLHGNLPHEVVCTENLTPFLKLLPCQGKAGISSLLDGHTLFDSSWQSMAVVIKPLYSPNEQLNLIQIEQTVDMVLDIERSKRPRGRVYLIYVLLPSNSSKAIRYHVHCPLKILNVTRPSTTAAKTLASLWQGSSFHHGA